MRKVIFSIIFSLFLYGGVESKIDTNNSKTETNETIVKNKLKEISRELNKMDFFIRYQQYQKLEQLKDKLKEIERKLKYLKRHRHKKRTEIASLELKKTAYKQQIEIMGGKNSNLFDALITIKPLPRPFHITNPFEIFSVINYKKEIKNTIKKYELEKKKIEEIISLLKQKKEILSKLKVKTSEIDKTLDDFKLIRSIYNSKLEQLKTEAVLYKEKMDNEENYQIKKLVSLIITIFLSILFFTILKIGFKKYSKNIKNIYLINKILNIMNFSVAILIIMFFYIDNATYLVTILGFASAGIAIAMKDWFMNLFGWFVILVNGNLKVGDRVKILLQNGNIEIVGDIIDITTSQIIIHEDVTYATYKRVRRAGRIIFVPNNIIFSTPIFNYTHAGLKTVWDGIDIVITFDSNAKKAEYIAKQIVKKYAKGYTDMTRIQLNRLRANYNIKNTNVEPRIFTFIGEYGIVVSCWYLNSYSTLALRSEISKHIIEAFQKEDDIKITYNTLKIMAKEQNDEKFNKIKLSL